MKRKIVWLVVSCLMVLALLAASCAKAEVPAAKEAAPATKEAAPATKEVTPAVKETTPAAAETPKYGGQLILVRNGNILNWDETIQPNWTLSRNMGWTNLNLIIGDWTKGPAGTNEYDWKAGNLAHPGNQVGQLAESWEFPDDTTIIFHIRKGVHWALDPNNAASRLVGGREFTADDVVFNEKRILWDPKTELYQTAGDARPLDVVATDKYTVKVKTPKGFQGMTWEYTGACIAMMAPEVAAKYGDYQKWENNVGQGPFILKDFVNMSSATWERNPSYYETDPVGPGKGNQLPYIDSAKYLIIPDLSTRMAALRTGKVDYDSGFGPIDAQQIIKTAPQVKYASGWGGFKLWSLRLDNLKPGLPWAGDVPYVPPNPSVADANALKVRRALNLAVNNPEMLQTLFAGQGSTLSFKIIPDEKNYAGVYTPLDQLPQDSRELFEYHPDKAKQLLTEAGYPNGFKASVIYDTGTAEYADVTAMIKNYWAKISVDVTLQPTTSAIYANIWLKHTYDEMILMGRSSYNPHVQYATYSTSSWNLSRVNDPVMDAYYFKMAEAYTDWEKKKVIMKEMNLYAIPKAYYVYWPVTYTYLFWQPWLKNFHGESSLGVFKSVALFKYTWLDQELKKSMGH
ncbi:MAG: hypothetical protein HY528_05055 [Chloroflexi bacterium]|nr:hypothetical protein [Chloroflexota bacterium]